MSSKTANDPELISAMQADQDLKTNDRFEVDQQLEACLMLTSCPGGYLKCIKNR